MNYFSYITSMKNHKVYELTNANNAVEYVGHSCRPNERLYKHLSKWGKFTNRNDISMNIVAAFETRLEAYRYQIQLQKEYGFETDNDLHRNDANNFISIEKKREGALKGKALGYLAIATAKAHEKMNSKYTCPHCSKEGQYRAMKRWHGNNCPQNK